MTKDPRFEIENEEIQTLLKKLATFLHGIMPSQEWGFALLVFKFREQDFFWISDADRQDMIKALREFIKREEGN